MIGRFAGFNRHVLSSLGNIDEGGGSVADEVSYDGIIAEIWGRLSQMMITSASRLIKSNVAVAIYREGAYGNALYTYYNVWEVYQVREDYWQKEVPSGKRGWYARTICVTKTGRLVVKSGSGNGDHGVKCSEEYEWADITDRLLLKDPTRLSKDELSDLLRGLSGVFL